ncbi:T9SS type A sorting domain-containing protein [Riemerella anatipestifer]|nr:T9SS type A sorting domain-containing protein [Riemerella anatipestifer]
MADDAELDNMVFPTSEWQTFADVSWYSDAVNEFTLTTEAQLAGLSKLVKEGNSFLGKTISLGNDLDLGEHLWTAIGYTYRTPFFGNFDGKHHTIKNLKVYRGDNGDFLGLFGYYASGNLKDLTIDGGMVRGKDTAGVLVGNFTSGATMSNCHIKNGKLLGVYDPNYTTSAFNVGLLCGSVTSSSVVDYCSAEGVIKGFQQVGGLVGSPWNKAVIKNSYFKGKVIGAYFVGGFYGGLQVGKIKNSYSVSTVDGASGTVGGFVGSIGGGGILENAHFNKTVAPMSGYGDAPAPGVGLMGHTTEAMKVQSFLDLLNNNRTPEKWKFESGVNEGYPVIYDAATMGVSEIKKPDQVSIYPTVAKDKLYLSDKAQTYTYQVLDVTGRVLKSGKTNASVEVGDLNRGVYLLKLENGQGYTVHKFMKD